MKTTFFSLFITLVLAVLLQTAIFPRLEIRGVTPNLILVVVILASLSIEWRPALFLALLGGLSLDFFSVGQFGIFALALVIISFLFGLSKSYLFTRANIFVFLIAVLAGTIIYYFLAMFLAGFFIWLHLSSFAIPWRENLFIILPIELVYNLILSALVFFIFNHSRGLSAKIY